VGKPKLPATTHLAIATQEDPGPLVGRPSCDKRLAAPDRWRALTRRGVGSLIAAVGLLAATSRPALAAPGDLDTSFGTGGLVRTNITSVADAAYGVAIQPDGKIVAVGTAGYPNSTFAVVRYKRDGTLDPTFGTGGVVRTDIGPYQDVAYGVALQPDGDVVVAGVRGAGRPGSDFALARYLPGGTLDPSFGSGGVVTTSVTTKQDEADGVGILSNGDIVAAGGAGLNAANPNFAVVRYLPDGQLDPTFGTGGVVQTDFGAGTFDWASGGLVVQPDDDVVAGGYTVSASARGDPRFALARYLADGTLDPAFGTGGKVITNFTTGFDYISSLALDASGDIVAAGEAGARTGRDVAALARYTPAGVLDTTFGTGGKVTTDYGKYGDAAIGVAVDPTTQDVVTAGAVGLGGSNPRFAVCRYTPAGVLDTTFGTGGKVFTDFSSSEDYANAVAIQAGGRIVVAGVAAQGSGNSSFALARYLDS